MFVIDSKLCRLAKWHRGRGSAACCMPLPSFLCSSLVKKNLASKGCWRPQKMPPSPRDGRISSGVALNKDDFQVLHDLFFPWKLEAECLCQAAPQMRSLKYGLDLAFFLLFCSQGWKGWFKASSHISCTRDPTRWMCISSWHNSWLDSCSVKGVGSAHGGCLAVGCVSHSISALTRRDLHNCTKGNHQCSSFPPFVSEVSPDAHSHSKWL